jgi:hypothetical protein
MGKEGDNQQVKNFHGERSCNHPLGSQSKWKEKLNDDLMQRGVRIEGGSNCIAIEADGGLEN